MRLFAFILPLILSLGGCANWDSIYRTHTFDLSQSVAKSAFIDSKQREIIAANYTVCPSPQADVMSAYAVELAGKADLPDSVKAELAAAAQSSAAYIGVRSRNIQFSRDQIYSLCIDRMNDVVDDGQYSFYKSRLHRYQVAMSAIEQLTDPAIAPLVTLGSSGSAGTSAVLQGYQAELDKLQQDKQKIEKSGGPKSDGQNLTAEEATKLKGINKDIVDLQVKIRTSSSQAVSGQSSGVAPVVSGRQGNPTNETVQAVTKIVVSTLLTDDSALLCVERLVNIENQANKLSGRGLNAAENAEVEYCRKVLSGQGQPLMKLDPKILDWVVK